MNFSNIKEFSSIDLEGSLPVILKPIKDLPLDQYNKLRSIVETDVRVSLLLKGSYTFIIHYNGTFILYRNSLNIIIERLFKRTFSLVKESGSGAKIGVQHILFDLDISTLDISEAKTQLCEF